MSQVTNTVRVLSTGSYLPGDPISNEMLEQYVGPLPDDILEGLQVKTRHWIADPVTGEQSESNSQMATKAILQALDFAGVGPEDVELLVVSTASPDYLLPPMATFVQDQLGLRRCATLEVRSGCAGAVEGLDVARIYLERGDYRNAVVVGSDVISPLLVPVFRGRDAGSVRMRDRLGLYSFGDGAAAVVLQADDDGGDGDGGFLGSAAIACVGGGRKPGMQIFGGGTHAPIHTQLLARRLVDLRIDVVESGKFTPYVIAEALADVLARSGVSADAVDLCVIPEGNAGYVTEEIREAGLLTREWLAVAGKIFENLTTVGATGSAAVPLALDDAWKTGKLRSGDRVMLLAIETSKWKYAGMMLSWTAPPYSR